MFKYYIVPCLLLLALASCNPVGENIIELPLQAGEISSAENIDLKKGDKVVIWSKLTLNDDEVLPDFKVRVNVENEGKSVWSDSLKVLKGRHAINSERSTEAYEVLGGGDSDGVEKDSTAYYSKRTFELDNADFIVPKDGKYNFDFKLKLDINSHNKGFSIILRKL
ncbi:hypothetical protein [Pedobacter caeni]|uniref:DUF4352 domain-containing protein n=1 Tax=Pedobacter caeni TaxID=288992 RepID=A0A1M4W8E1_9SPHI|nr:hypothetical protein [Pedobacter caeni]SHE77486.1 hypothetical protein SAMN04488522_1011175 [Pedobacter caeni]